MGRLRLVNTGIILAALTVLGSLAALPLHAQDTFWQHDPATPGDWSEPANWTDGLPDSTTRAYVNNGGEVLLASGFSRTKYLHLGHMGVGSMVQSGGALRVDERTFMGYEPGDNGRYELLDGDFRVLDGMLLGIDGTAEFIQQAGTATFGNIWIAGYYGSGAGSAAYRHTGGVNNANGITLYGNGAYELSDSAALNVNFLGAYGSFTQSGGTNNAREVSASQYLITAGDLETTELTVSAVATYGTAEFTQNGTGSNVTVNEKLFLGYGGSHYGEYNLDQGTLWVNGHEYVGYSGGQGVFRQSGGVHVVDDLSVRTHNGNTSSVEISGGFLVVNHSFDLQDGQLSFPSSGGEVHFIGQASADLARGTIQNGANGVMVGGSQSLLIFPSGFDPYTQLASFTNPGHTHIAGSTLSLPSGKIVRFTGAIDDQVICEGSLIGTYDLNNGLILLGSGCLNAGTGTVTIQDQVSRMEGGSVAADTLRVGFGALGSFRQLGGMVSIADRVAIGTVGNDPQDPIPSGAATYELGPGAVLNSHITEIAMYGGTAEFVQTGGIHEAKSVYITKYVYHPSEGAYDMTGGELRLSDALWVGGYSNCMATFSMTNGAVTVGTIRVAINGSTSRFVQDGGSVEADNLQIASSSYAEAEGTYSISGGSLVIGTLELGAASEGEGWLEVSGGAAAITVTGEFHQEALGNLLSMIGPDGISEIRCGTANLAGSCSVLDTGAPFGRFSLLHATEGISGMFTSVTLPGPDWSWGIDGGNTLYVEHVPEPATMSLLALGALTLLKRHRR